METLLIDVFTAIPPARRLGLRAWIARMALDLKMPFENSVAQCEPYLTAVNHGRWVAYCPNCNGSENVGTDDPVMMCFSCGNYHLAGKLAPVQFPTERRAIEQLLVERPRQNQNWTPDEDVAKLAAENAEHGVGRTEKGVISSHGLDRT